MAMPVDLGLLMKGHLDARSPEAKTTGRVVTTVFAKEVDEVSIGGVTAFNDGSAAANKAVAAGDLTPEDAKLVKDCLRDLMIAKKDFATAFYKGE